MPGASPRAQAGTGDRFSSRSGGLAHAIAIPEAPHARSYGRDGRAWPRRAGVAISTLPGLPILVTVLFLDILGDWLRDRLAPTPR